MPEMISKYPDVALKILKDAQIKCGTGAKQQILTACPADKFCSLPTGELCIYGISDVPKMTQVQPYDFISITAWLLPAIAFCILIFLTGIIVGRKLKK